MHAVNYEYFTTKFVSTRICDCPRPPSPASLVSGLLQLLHSYARHTDWIISIEAEER